MKIDIGNEEELTTLQNNLIEREKDERLASASLASETLSALNISIDALPQRCQELLLKCASLQVELDQSLDPVAISVRQTEALSQRMVEEYGLLELKQQNAKLRVQIERNRVFIAELKRELKSAKESLASQNPNPGNIQDHIRQTKQKLVSYEEVYEKAKAQFTKLHVPEAVLPKSIEELAGRLAALKEQESRLAQQVDDITLARQVRDTLTQLRKEN